MKRGNTRWKVSDGGIISVQWMDNRAVRFLNNFLDHHQTQLISKKQKDGTKQHFTARKNGGIAQKCTKF